MIGLHSLALLKRQSVHFSALESQPGSAVPVFDGNKKHVDSEFKQLFRLAVTHDERRSPVPHLLRKQSILALMVIILRSLLNALRRRNICLTLVARAMPKEQGLYLGRCKTSHMSQSWACRSLAGTGTVST